MKLRELFLKLWRDQFGILARGSQVVIAGAGISGMHLAHALVSVGVRVTLYDPRPIGGVRIPLMRACHRKEESNTLLQYALPFSRKWYSSRTWAGVESHGEKESLWFVVNTRLYLRFLKADLHRLGVIFVEEKFIEGSDFLFDARGITLQKELSNFTQSIDGHELYLSRLPKEKEVAGTNMEEKNYFCFRSRAAIVYPEKKDTTIFSSKVREAFPNVRCVHFTGTRLASRDRLPLIGFKVQTLDKNYDEFREKFMRESFARFAVQNHLHFLFTAMGYHALTLAPYIANCVASHLVGTKIVDENVVSTLTPTRFLPRTR